MKLLFTLVLLLIPTVLDAAVPPTSAEQAYQVSRNLLLNPGFEESIKRGWASSNGNYGFSSDNGNRIASWQPSGVGQTFGQTVAVGRLGGTTCTAQLNYKGADANYVWEVTDGTNVLVSKTLSARTAFAAPLVGLFTCPASGNMVTRLRSLAASPALIYLDDAYLGAGPTSTVAAQVNVGSEWVGAVKIYGCASRFSQSNTGGFANFPAQTGCQYQIVSGSSGISAPATNIPGFTLTGKAGVYRIDATGTIGNGTGTASAVFRFSDGTRVSNEENDIEGTPAGLYPGSISGLINYTSAPSAQTIQIQARTGSSNVANVFADATTATPTAAGGYVLTLNVYRMPSSATLAGALITKEPVEYASQYMSTMVTTTPTQPGQWRGLCRAANTYNYTNCTPAFLPSVANGFFLWGTGQNLGYATSDGATAPSRYEINIGAGKSAFEVLGFEAANRSTPFRTDPLFISANAEGITKVYDSNTGVLTVYNAMFSSSTNTTSIGRRLNSDPIVITSGWVDVKISNNALAVGLTQATNEVLFTGGAGYGSTNTTVRRFTALASKGDAITCTQSATLGDSCTINKAGQYYVAGWDRAGTAVILPMVTANATGAALNTFSGAAIRPFAISPELYLTNTGTVPDRAQATALLDLPAGTVLRWQDANSTGGSTEATPTVIGMRITKLRDPFEVAGAGGNGLANSTLVRVYGSAGWGSSGNLTRRFSTVDPRSYGTLATWNDDATNGGYFLIAEDSICTVNYYENLNVAGEAGIVLNSTNFASGPGALPNVQKLSVTYQATANSWQNNSWSGRLLKGDKVTMQAGVASTGTGSGPAASMSCVK